MSKKPGPRTLGITLLAFGTLAGAVLWVRHSRSSVPLQVQASPGVVNRPPVLPEQQAPAPIPEGELEKRGLAAAADGQFETARDFLLQAVKPMEAWDVDKEASWASDGAALQLGVMLRDGQGGKKDPINAARCFVLAQRNQVAPLDAYLFLISMYRSGEGVPRDLKFADIVEKELLRQARDSVWYSGRPSDAIRAAEMFMEGRIFPRDLLAAANLYYVAEDKETSRKVLEQAAQQGSAEAHDRLASSYLGEGWPVTEKDPLKAIEHFQAAGELGKPESWYQLGRLYQTGVHFPRDEAKAFEYFVKAPGPSAYELGMAYWEGKVTTRDPEKAHELLLRTIQGNYIRAEGLAVLATMYRDGIGAPKDPVLAAVFSPLIATKDAAHPKSEEFVKEAWKGGAKQVIDIQKLLRQKAPAASWFEYGKALKRVTRISSAAIALTRASQLGSADAELLLGRLYMGDWEMDNDEKAAVVESLETDVERGKALIASAVRKGKRPPVPPSDGFENPNLETALANANKYSGQDPRRLFYLLKVWSSMGGC